MTDLGHIWEDQEAELSLHVLFVLAIVTRKKMCVNVGPDSEALLAY